MCGGDVQCIYDATVTGNLDIGLGTMETSMANDQSVEILGELCTSLVDPSELHWVSSVRRTGESFFFT